MSWFPQKRQRTWVQRICESVLTAGPVPKHVAIIMDGNRRFAVKKSIAKSEGHVKGFDKLAETLEWCLDLGITEVTVYAFSIENFKRSAEEVTCLMELSRQKFARLLQEKHSVLLTSRACQCFLKASFEKSVGILQFHIENSELQIDYKAILDLGCVLLVQLFKYRDLIHQHGVCVRIIGDISLLPRDLQELLAEAVSISANNTRAILNVCFAYTARDDMCMAIRELATGVKEGYIRNSDISESLIEKCLYTSPCTDVDLLIRTSGEVRLSDFLLWESSFSCLAFVKVLWPEFSIWHMYAAILHYQRNYSKIQIVRQNHTIERERLQRESDFQSVTQESNKSSSQDNEASASLESDSPCTKIPEQKSIQARVQLYAKERERRIETFLTHVTEKRESYYRSLLPTHPVITAKPVSVVASC